MESAQSFSKRYPVRVDETGPDARLTMISLFCYIQDLISSQVSSIDIGINDLNRRGLTWVLSRIKIETDYCPEYGDYIQAETWAGRIKSFYVPRHFELRSVQTGKLVARGSAFWLILDLKKLAPVDPVLYYPLEKDDLSKEEIFSSAGTIRNTSAGHPLEFQALCSNIDINNHVNNRFFPAYVQDWLAEEQKQPVRITQIKIHFNSVFLFGEKIICSGEINGSDFRVVGNSPLGKNIFVSKGRFEVIRPKIQYPPV